MKLQRFFTALFLITLLFIFPTLTYAQYFSLSISPPILEIAIKPGKSLLIAYTVKNYGDPVVLTPKVVSFESADDYGNVNLKEDIEGPVRFYLDNSEIKLNSPFFLQPNSSQQLLLRIRVPENAPEGDFYYSLILTSTTNSPQKKNVAATTKATIAANILITITESGKLDIKPKIIYFDIIPRFRLSLFGKTIKIVDSLDQIPIVLKLSNTGKNYLKAYGEIQLEGAFKTKASWNLIPKNVLSNSQRLLIASDSAGIKRWVYKNKPVSLILPKGLYLGKYKLRAKIDFGEADLKQTGKPVLYASTSFVALPIKASLSLFALVLILSLIAKGFKNQ